jgi:putative RecB family exonuclease
MRTSYSALETFKQCPQKYKFESIDKIRQPKSREAVFGTLIHSSLKYLFTANPLFPSLDEVIAHFRNGWSESEMPDLTEEEKQAYLEQGEALLRRFYAKNQPWNYNVVDMETRFELVLDDPKTKTQHTLAGIIDRIDKPTDTEYEIIDYKTSRKMKAQDALANDLQLSLYHVALLNRWPHINPQAVTLSLYYVKHNEKLSSKRAVEQTAHTKEAILNTIRDIETRTASGEFPPRPSALCDWCGYKNMCPAWKYLFTEPKIENTEQRNHIEQSISEYVTLKKESQAHTKRLAELQQNIKSYMEQEGITRVFSSAGTISKTEQVRHGYDYEAIHKTLEDHGRIDVWNALLSPDDKKIKKIMDTLPSPLQEKIVEARTEKTFETLTISVHKL